MTLCVTLRNLDTGGLGSPSRLGWCGTKRCLENFLDPKQPHRFKMKIILWDLSPRPSQC